MGAPTLEEAHAALSRRLGPGSLGHCERVSDAARRIAVSYGLDEEPCALAGLLHDWSRDDDDATLLADAERYGLSVNAIEHARPYLLHARTAAERLREAFPGLDGDVIEAVAAHTLGSPGMGEPAKAVYVADTIEDARTWEGVEELRRAVGAVTLDELFTRAFQHTLAHVVDRRRRIHPQAIEVWNSLVGAVRP